MPRPYSIPSRYRRNPYRNTTADRQRIFSIVWEWFVTRKHPRCTHYIQGLGPSCAYRPAKGDNTNGCAVGIFLPSCAPPMMLNLRGSPGALFAQFPTEMRRIFDDTLLSFLIDLQNAHDSGPTPESMTANLTDVARKYTLTVPEPKP